MHFSGASRRSNNNPPARPHRPYEPRHPWNPSHNQRPRGHYSGGGDRFRPRGGNHGGPPPNRYQPYPHPANRPRRSDNLGHYRERYLHEEQRRLTEQFLNLDQRSSRNSGWGDGRAGNERSAWDDDRPLSTDAILGNPLTYRDSVFASAVQTSEEVRQSELARSRQVNHCWDPPAPEENAVRSISVRNDVQNENRVFYRPRSHSPEDMEIPYDPRDFEAVEPENVVPFTTKPSSIPKPIRAPASILTTLNAVDRPSKNDILKKQFQRQPLVDHLLQRRAKGSAELAKERPVLQTLLILPPAPEVSVVLAVPAASEVCEVVPTKKSARTAAECDRRIVIECRFPTNISKVILHPLSLNARFLCSLANRFPAFVEGVERCGTLVVEMGRFGQLLEQHNALLPSLEPSIHCRDVVYDCKDMRVFWIKFMHLRREIEGEKSPRYPGKPYADVLALNMETLSLFPVIDDERFLVCPTRDDDAVQDKMSKYDSDDAQNRCLLDEEEALVRCCARKDPEPACKVKLISSTMRRMWTDQDGNPIRFCPAHLGDYIGHKLCPKCFETEQYAHTDREDYERSVLVCCGTELRGAFHLFHEECFPEKVCPHCGNSNDESFTTLDVIGGEVDLTRLKTFGSSAPDRDDQSMQRMLFNEQFDLASGLLEHENFVAPTRYPDEFVHIYPVANSKKAVTVKSRRLRPKRRQPDPWRKFNNYPMSKLFSRRNGMCEERFAVRSGGITLHERYQSALLAICDQNEECSCRPICSSSTCSCSKWMTSSFYYTEDGRLILDNITTQRNWMKECGETCRCDVRFCFNRRTQQPSKVKLEVDKIDKSVVTPHPIVAGTFICRLSGILREFPVPPPKEKVFIYPKFGIWPKGKMNCRVGLDELPKCFRRVDQVRKIRKFRDATPNIIPIMVMECPSMPHTGLSRLLAFPGIAFFAVRDIKAGEELIYARDFRDVDCVSYEDLRVDYRARAAVEETGPCGMLEDLFPAVLTADMEEENFADVDLDSE